MSQTSVSRYIAGIVVGAGVSMSLLFVMQHLIETGQAVVTDNKPVRLVPWVRVKMAETVTKKDRKLKPPKAPEAAPPTLAPPMDATSLTATTIFVPPVNLDRKSGQSRKRLPEMDGDYLPIVKISPAYPPRARTRGIEGHCTVEYTVTTSGTVADPRVVDCASSLFERASIAAALKFKYRPRVIDGVAVNVQGVRNRFVFELKQ